MSFLDGVNGVTSKKTTTSSGSSSGFLGGIRQLDEREQKLSELKAEAETAAAESRRLNSPASLAMETVKGIPKTVWQGAKALVDDPMRVLATPVIRAEQAIAASAGRAIGGDFGGRLERAANQPMTLPSALGGQGGTIEPQRGFDNGGAAQIAGDTAQYAATIYTGGRTKPLVDLAGKGFIKQAAIQGSKEGAIGMGGYMGGGEAAREGSTAGSIAMESGKGLVLGGFLGGVLGGGGAALAKPGALRAAAEMEATRMRPLPVRDDGPPGGVKPSSAQQAIAKGLTEDEFVKGQTPIFHGTTKTFDKFDAELSPGGSAWFTDSRKALETGADVGLNRKAGETVKIMDRYIKPGLKLVDRNTAEGKKLADDLMTGQLESQGYRGIIHEADKVRGKYVELFYPNEDALTTSQLRAEYADELAKSKSANLPKQSSTTKTVKSGSTPDFTFEPIKEPSKSASAKLPTRKPGKASEGLKAPVRNQITAPTGRLVMMDIPRKTATVPVREPKAGEAVTKPKAATDINKRLAALGFDQVDEDLIPGITSINKADQIEKVAHLLEDVETSKRMAYGEIPVPDGVAPQVLFNAVKNRAIEEVDGATLQRLATSKIATERSEAAKTLGSAGFNNGPSDAIDAMQDITKTRTKAAERRKQPSDVKKEVKTEKAFIKKAQAKRTWDDVVDSLTC